MLIFLFYFHDKHKHKKYINDKKSFRIKERKWIFSCVIRKFEFFYNWNTLLSTKETVSMSCSMWVEGLYLSLVFFLNLSMINFWFCCRHKKILYLFILVFSSWLNKLVIKNNNNNKMLEVSQTANEFHLNRIASESTLDD